MRLEVEAEVEAAVVEEEELPLVLVEITPLCILVILVPQRPVVRLSITV
jgi:hypothetical protein